MPTTLLSIGPPNTILQNVQCALPARLCHVTSTVAVEGSNDGTTWAAATGVNTTGALMSSLFIRCPTASAVVVCKAYG